MEIETLKRIFEEIPSKSNAAVKNKCVGCGREVIVNISITSAGFGLQGGVILKYSPGSPIVKCLDCYNLDSNMR